MNNIEELMKSHKLNVSQQSIFLCYITNKHLNSILPADELEAIGYLRGEDHHELGINKEDVKVVIMADLTLEENNELFS